MEKKLNSPLVLLTDFGLSDGYAGVLKGVILSINPVATIIDLSHDIEPQNILQAAFVLHAAADFFPVQTIFCTVVDPGVGSSRKAILIQTEKYFFIGPDNGVLWQAAQASRIKKIIHLTCDTYFLDTISNTFHGRDIFAPCAAHLSKGITDISEFGPQIDTCVTLETARPIEKENSLGVTVIHIDRFGNLILNLEKNTFYNAVLNHRFCLTIKDKSIINLCESYSQAQSGTLFLIVSSSGFMEISLKNSNAARFLGACTGTQGLLTRL